MPPSPLAAASLVLRAPRIGRSVHGVLDRLARRLGRMPTEDRVRWFGARRAATASRALANRATRLAEPGGWVLTVGGESALHRKLRRQLTRAGTVFRTLTVEGVSALRSADTDGLACVVSGVARAQQATAVARAVLGHPDLSQVPFEYATGLEPERSQFRRQDEYQETWFSSPVLLARPSPYAIYDESLRIFRQKCGLRDYLDLYQVLVSLDERRIPGDVAEFGSYEGHSGWLIARTLEALGSQRQLHLFDTFDAFPEEGTGVDYFWSHTHQVRFEEVQRRLAAFQHVRLVRGDFAETLPAAAIDRLALAYVDCDSYRGVSYVAGAVFNDLLNAGGAIVFEDYGHPALLGCRVAVHEHFDGRADCLRFFSQFSGLYIVVKTGDPTGQADPGVVGARPEPAGAT